MVVKMERTFLQKIQIWAIKLISKIKWEPVNVLSEDNTNLLREKLTNDYYIIATRRSNFLTTFFINLGHFLLTGKWGYYSHVLVNLEDQVHSDDDFIFMEATTHGTKVSTFNDVFTGVNAVCLIKPKNLTLEEWTTALDKSRVYLGRPYDNLFELRNDLEINCVELIRLALQNVPDYHIRFAEFEKLIKAKRKLTPQMFYECPDFEVVFEVR